MAITATITKSHVETIALSEREAREITVRYLKEVIMINMMINTKGELGYFEEHHHGSDTWVSVGYPSPLQRATWELLQAMGAAE